MNNPPKTVETAAKHRSRLPTFASIQEESAFWDSHDSTEFEDEFEDASDVRFVPAGMMARAITIERDKDASVSLWQRARAFGTAPEFLAREWTLARLRTRHWVTIRDQ